MDFDEIQDGLAGFQLAVGLIGLGLMVIIPLVYFLIPWLWVYLDFDLLFTITIACWLTTFILPGISTIGKYSLAANKYSKDAEYYSELTYAIQSGDSFRSKALQTSHTIKNIIYYIIFMGLPIIGAVIGTFYSGHNVLLNILNYYPLILQIILFVVYGFASGSSFIFLAIISVICTFLLWFLPAFDPYIIITTYITTGEVVLVGSSK